MAKNQMGLGDLGGVAPPTKPAKKRRGVAIDLEKDPIPKPQSNLDEVNEELRERFGDLATPPENMYVKDTPEEIAERNAMKAVQMEQAMQNYQQLKQQGDAEEAAAMDPDPLGSMMSNVPKTPTTHIDEPEEEPAQVPTPPKPKKIGVMQGVNPGVDVNSGGFQPIDPSTFAPHIPTAEEADEAANQIWNDLDAAVERTKRQITEDQEKLFDKMREEQMEMAAKAADEAAEKDMEGVKSASLEDEDDGEDFAADAYTGMPKRDPSKKKPAAELNESDMDDFDDELDEMFEDSLDENPDDGETEEERQARIEETRKNITAEIDAKIRPIKNKIDLAGFTIAKKPISAIKVLKHAETAVPEKHADWVLPRAKRRITMSALSGAEIINLNPANSQQNRFNTIKRMYQILYRHVVDANKPSFEAWMKTIYLEDVPHLYFCAFRATFGDSNFMPATCTEPKCQNAFLQDLEDTEDLVVYDDDETKDMVHKLLEGDTTTTENDEAIASETYQISDDYVITIHRPTIYTTLMETASLPEAFLNKYSDMLDVISYIDGMYLIDSKNQQLIPIETKVDPNSASKTAAYKIRTFHDILRKVSSDIYSNLYGYIVKHYEEDEKIHFRVPETECPKCKAKISAQDLSAQQLLFTRHQLAAYGNI
ncbi:hypothetical protein [uncultured Duncaniella sp.]|uniref:hypothetical protein n=1 Tax=uncultured Duncaniella sp. TaxID=2768039 RepID=UPI002603B10B|nr:hypothetical protein [uncultured Duncaniella sp.]